MNGVASPRVDSTRRTQKNVWKAAAGWGQLESGLCSCFDALLVGPAPNAGTVASVQVLGVKVSRGHDFRI